MFNFFKNKGVGSTVPEWQRKIAEAEEIEKRRRVASERAAAEARKIELANRTREALEANLKKLEVFQCHICQTPSRKPGSKTIVTGTDFGVATSFGEAEDWSKPGDLFDCKTCRELTCSQHIYKGICQTCAEKM